jgi:hypothetical protein
MINITSQKAVTETAINPTEGITVETGTGSKPSETTTTSTIPIINWTIPTVNLTMPQLPYVNLTDMTGNFASILVGLSLQNIALMLFVIAVILSVVKFWLI